MIGRRLFSWLLKADQEEPVVSLELRDLGLNSMAVEIRAWCEQVFGLDGHQRATDDGSGDARGAREEGGC